MNAWKDIDPKYITPERFLTCIEISKGMKNKYELDKKTGLLKLDRIFIYLDSLSSKLWFYSINLC